MGDSILFYAGGTFPYTNHVAVTLLANSSLYVEVDFGNYHRYTIYTISIAIR